MWPLDITDTLLPHHECVCFQHVCITKAFTLITTHTHTHTHVRTSQSWLQSGHCSAPTALDTGSECDDLRGLGLRRRDPPWPLSPTHSCSSLGTKRPRDLGPAGRSGQTQRLCPRTQGPLWESEEHGKMRISPGQIFYTAERQWVVGVHTHTHRHTHTRARPPIGWNPPSGRDPGPGLFISVGRVITSSWHSHPSGLSKTVSHIGLKLSGVCVCVCVCYLDSLRD